MYRTEFTNAAVFKKLQEKIPQVSYIIAHNSCRLNASFTENLANVFYSAVESY